MSEHRVSLYHLFLGHSTAQLLGLDQKIYILAIARRVAQHDRLPSAFTTLCSSKYVESPHSAIRRTSTRSSCDFSPFASCLPTGSADGASGRRAKSSSAQSQVIECFQCNPLIPHAPTQCKCSNNAFLHFLASLFPPFLSLFPPLSISKCPAFCAKSFSVCAVKPQLLLCLILFCEMMDAFFGLMTRAPGLGPVRDGL